MRILLVMLFGLILTACGQDYEEIYGIKIGDPISQVKGLDEYKTVTEFCEFKTYGKRDLVNVNLVKKIFAVNDVVEGVMIYVDEKEFEDRLNALREGYSETLEHDVAGEMISFSSYFKPYRMEARPSELTITYASKEFAETPLSVFYDCHMRKSMGNKAFH